MKLEQNNLKCFSWKTADLELRRFRNDGAKCIEEHWKTDSVNLKQFELINSESALNNIDSYK